MAPQEYIKSQIKVVFPLRSQLQAVKNISIKNFTLTEASLSIVSFMCAHGCTWLSNEYGIFFLYHSRPFA